MRWPFVGNRRPPGVRRGRFGFYVAVVLAIAVVAGWILSYTHSGEMGVVREACLGRIGTTWTIDMEHRDLWFANSEGEIFITAARGRFHAVDFEWHDSAAWRIRADWKIRSLWRVAYCHENPLIYSRSYWGYRFAGKQTPDVTVLAMSVPYWSLMVGVLGLVAYYGWKVVRRKQAFRGFECVAVMNAVPPSCDER